METGYRNLNKWDQSIEALHHLCLSSTHPDYTMLPLLANTAMAQTHLSSTVLILLWSSTSENKCNAKMCSLHLDEVSTEMHLIQAQLFYFNGDTQQAYCHLESYLDAYLVKCKLRCYTYQQRVRHMSFPFSCASCMVASYCGRKHQKLTWKNERICHKVLCPLLGHLWTAKKKRGSIMDLRMKTDVNVKWSLISSLRAFALVDWLLQMAIFKRQIQLTSQVIRKPRRLPKKPRKVICVTWGKSFAEIGQHNRSSQWHCTKRKRKNSMMESIPE